MRCAAAGVPSEGGKGHFQSRIESRGTRGIEAVILTKVLDRFGDPDANVLGTSRRARERTRTGAPCRSQNAQVITGPATRNYTVPVLVARPSDTGAGTGGMR